MKSLGIDLDTTLIPEKTDIQDDSFEKLFSWIEK